MHFDKGPNYSKPISPVNWRRTKKNDPAATESYTCAWGTVPADADGLRTLQRGVVMALITSGADAGKVGPFSAAAADGREDTANIVGINDTFDPATTLNITRDLNISCVFALTVAYQAECVEHDAADAPIALTDATRDAALVNGVRIDIKFT